MRNRAFTVIELLLAVVITAVISAVAVVSYNTVVTGSDERICSDEATAVLKMVYLDSVTTNSPVQSLQAARAPENDTITPFLSFSFFDDIPESVASVTIENGSIEVTQADGSVATATWDPETGASDFSCAVAANSDGEGSTGEGSTGDERELNALPPLDVFEPSEIGFMNEIGAGFIGFSQLEDATSYEVQAVSAAGETISDAVVSCTDGSCLGTFPDLGRSFLHDFWDFRVRALTEDAVTEWAEIQARSPQSLELCGEYGSLRLFDKDLMFTCDVTTTGFVVLEDSRTSVSDSSTYLRVTLEGDSKVYGSPLEFDSIWTVTDTGSLTASPSETGTSPRISVVYSYGEVVLTGFSGGRVQGYEGAQTTISDSAIGTVFTDSATTITDSSVYSLTVGPKTPEEAASSRVSDVTATMIYVRGAATPSVFANNSGQDLIFDGSTTWSPIPQVTGFENVRIDVFSEDGGNVLPEGVALSWPSEVPLSFRCWGDSGPLRWGGFVDFSNATLSRSPSSSYHDYQCRHEFYDGVNLDNATGQMDRISLIGGSSTIRNANLAAGVAIHEAGLTMESTTLRGYKYRQFGGRKRVLNGGTGVGHESGSESAELVVIRDSDIGGVYLRSPFTVERNQMGSAQIYAPTDLVADQQVFVGNTITSNIEQDFYFRYAAVTVSGASAPFMFADNEVDGELRHINLFVDLLRPGMDLTGFESLRLRNTYDSDPLLREGDSFTFPDLTIHYDCGYWPQKGGRHEHKFLGDVSFNGTSFNQAKGASGYYCGFDFENVVFNGAKGELHSASATGTATVTGGSNLAASISAGVLEMDDSVISGWRYSGAPGRSSNQGGVGAGSVLRLGPGATFLGVSARAPSTAALVQVVGTKQNPVVFTSECDPIANPANITTCGVAEALTTKRGGSLIIGQVTGNPANYSGAPKVEVRNTVFAFAETALTIDVIPNPNPPTMDWPSDPLSLGAFLDPAMEIFQSFSSALNEGGQAIVVADVDFIANDFSVDFKTKWNDDICAYESYLPVDKYYAAPVRAQYTDVNKLSNLFNQAALEYGSLAYGRMVNKILPINDLIWAGRSKATKAERLATWRVNTTVHNATAVRASSSGMAPGSVAPGEVITWMIDTYKNRPYPGLPNANYLTAGPEQCNFGNQVPGAPDLKLPVVGLPWLKTVKLRDETWVPNTTYSQSLVPLVEPFFPEQETDSNDWIYMDIPEAHWNVKAEGFGQWLADSAPEREERKNRVPDTPLFNSTYASTSSSLSLSWLKDEDPLFTRGYLVEIETSPGQWEAINPDCPDCIHYSNTASFTGLSPDTDYKVRVRTVSDYGTVGGPSVRIFTTSS